MIDGIVLGFDFGMRRIGVAIGNRVTRQARPLTTVDAADNDARWKSLSALIDEWEPVELAVGVPRHPDGTPHAMTVRASDLRVSSRAATACRLCASMSATALRWWKAKPMLMPPRPR